MLKHIPFYGSLLGRELADGKKSTNSHVLVYGAIEAHSFGERGCIASNELIAQETGLKKSTVRVALSEISRGGWVDVKLNANNFRTLIVPLLVIDTPISGHLQPYQSPLTPPSVDTEHRIQSIGNSKETVIDNTPAVAGHLAQVLHTLMSVNYHFLKVDEKQLRQWAKDIDKLNRIDGYDWETIEAVIRWSQEDDFWKQNIRSGAKLRKQFETLLVRIKSTPKRMEIIS